MKKEQVKSDCLNFLSNNEILRAVNEVLRYLQGRNSYLEPILFDIRARFLTLENANINTPTPNYQEEIEKIKSRIILCLQDLPESDPRSKEEQREEKKGPAPLPLKENGGGPGSDPIKVDGVFSFIYKLLKDPWALSIALAIILVAYFAIRATGKDPLCLLNKDWCGKTDMPGSRSWAETEASRQSKPYAIVSIIQHILFEDIVENNAKFRKAYYRNSYTIRALRDISFNENIFLEEYKSSVIPNPITLWAGSEYQKIHDVKPDEYYVKFSAKRDEVKTLVTGADYKYRLPFAGSSNSASCFSDLRLENDEWMVCYPNDQDFIDHLTMIVEAANINLLQVANGSFRKDSVMATNNIIYRQYQNNKYTLVASWDQLKPGECIAMKFKWELPR